MYGTNMEITNIPALEITSRQGLAKDLYFVGSRVDSTVLWNPAQKNNLVGTSFRISQNRSGYLFKNGLVISRQINEVYMER